MEIERGNGMTEYKYTPLAPDGSQIRVLELLPGQRSAAVYLRLKTIQFEDDKEWDFEALSYTWGSTDDPATAFIDKLDGTWAAMDITRNLMVALLQLRYVDRPRYLYVDAICINQDDLVEKGQQVALMADLYYKAPTVLAWLGPEIDETKMAIECLEMISSHVLVLPDYRLESLTGDSTWGNADTHLPFGEEEIKALAHLLGRPFFTRLWIWQEILLAEDRCYFVCGCDKIAWPRLRNGISCLMRKAMDPHTPLTDHLHKLSAELEPLLRGLIASRILFALNDLRSRRCVDPRDRVYVSFGICRENVRSFQIMPDYSKSVQAVYEEFAIRHIEVRSNLEVLDFVASENNVPNLPSWVPDWSAARGCRPFDYSVGARLWSNTFPYSDHTLKVKGKVLGTIRQVEAFGTHSTTVLTEQVQQLTTSFVARLLARGLISDDPIKLLLYANVFFALRIAETHLPPHSSYASRDQCQSTLRHLFSGLDIKHSGAGAFTSLRSFFANCNGRSFFVFDNGTFGLAPLSVQLGDVVVILVGSQHPMTVRPLSNGRYNLIGPTLISGNMHLEAILGPLLEEYEPVYQFDDQGSAYIAYRNKATDRVSLEDPRLGPLPSGWESVSHRDDMYHPCYEHSDKGERRTHHNDPRLDVRVLEAEGHRFEAFQLV